MKTLNLSRFGAIIAAMSLTLAACDYDEDPGSAQLVEAEFSFQDFDRLEMGDALNVTVTQGSEFSIQVKGDQRNVEDLIVKRSGSTLEMHYKNTWRNIRRHHTTYVTIVMPSLVSAGFSGAVTSEINEFESEDFHLELSGASTCKLQLAATYTDFKLTGASDLTVEGTASSMDASLSGASRLSAFGFAVETADLDLSGASRASVNATDRLRATASGASDVGYMGSPHLVVSTSGASNIHQE
jgi:hypothetical protein